MSRAKEYELRKMYIEKVLGTTLKARRGFQGIRYGREPLTDAEYIRISDIRGTTITLNITGRSLEQIMIDVFKVVVIGTMGKHERITVPEIITDRETLLELAPLFKPTGL